MIDAARDAGVQRHAVYRSLSDNPKFKVAYDSMLPFAPFPSRDVSRRGDHNPPKTATKCGKLRHSANGIWAGAYQMSVDQRSSVFPPRHSDRNIQHWQPAHRLGESGVATPGLFACHTPRANMTKHDKT